MTSHKGFPKQNQQEKAFQKPTGIDVLVCVLVRYATQQAQGTRRSNCYGVFFLLVSPTGWVLRTRVFVLQTRSTDSGLSSGRSPWNTMDLSPDTTCLGLPGRTAEKRPGVPGGSGLIGIYDSSPECMGTSHPTTEAHRLRRGLPQARWTLWRTGAGGIVRARRFEAESGGWVRVGFSHCNPLGFQLSSVFTGPYQRTIVLLNTLQHQVSHFSNGHWKTKVQSIYPWIRTWCCVCPSIV